MKKSISFIALVFLASITHSQATEERRTYYDIYNTKVKESWNVKAGTSIKHGEYKEFDQSGDVITKAYFTDNQLNGAVTRYHTVNSRSIGIVRLKQVYHMDEFIEETSYFNNGKINYKKVNQGTWTYYHKNGQVGMTATVHPGGQWNGEGDSEMPKGDEFYLLNPSGKPIKVKDIKWYSEGGKLLGENYFNSEGISIKNINYNLESRKISEWFKEENSGLYTEVMYYENGTKAVSTQFVLESKNLQDQYEHLEVVKNGMQKRWDETGTLINQGKYEDDIRVGAWKIYYDEKWNEVPLPSEASYYREIEFNSNGLPIGIVKDYYISGVLQAEGRLSSINPDIKDGEYKVYYPSGELQSIENLNQGVYNGLVTLFDESGNKTRVDSLVNNQVTKREFWANGWKNGEASFETMEFAQDPNDSMNPYKDQYLVGHYVLYYSNGAIKSKGDYNHSFKPIRKMGKWIYYDENGNQTKEEEWSNTGRLISE